jgi:serine/threonine protein kinase
MKINEKYRIFKGKDFAVNPANVGLKKKKTEIGGGGFELDVDEGMKSSAKKLGGTGEAELTDFDIKKVLGRGAFGKVFLVTHKEDSKTLYAMKAMRKDMIIKQNMMDFVMDEIEIMQ